jgi:hypothetical protein
MKSPVHFDFMLDQAISGSDELHAPAEALRRARRALTEHAGCFWMRQPSAPLQDRADVKLIVRRLRENGGPTAWQTALEIEACL